MTKLIVSDDGVFVLSGGQYAAWSRRIDRDWLGEQLDTRPRRRGDDPPEPDPNGDKPHDDRPGQGAGRPHPNRDGRHG